MTGLQDLREKRTAIKDQIQDLLNPSKHAYTKEVNAKVDGLFAEVFLVEKHIANIEKAVAAAGGCHDDAGNPDRNQDPNFPRVAAVRSAFVRALRYGVDRLAPEDQALIAADAPGNRGRIQAVAEGSGAAGGFLVPTIVMPQVLVKLKAFGGVRGVANILSTSGGAPIAWPTMDDTASRGEIILENVAASNSDLVFGQTTLNAYKFSSKIVPVSMEVLQDSAANVESVVIDALTVRIARAQNYYFTVGTGSSEPQGVVPAAGAGYVMPAGNTTSVTYDGLMNLYHSVDPAYRDSPNCAFMMHDSTWKNVKNLKDSAGRPLWLPNTSGVFADRQQPETLMGKPLVINQDMPVMAANAKSILFGDFSQYMIRDVMDVLILRFTDSAYAKFGQVGFLAWARADGRLISASNSAINYLQNSAT